MNKRELIERARKVQRELHPEAHHNYDLSRLPKDNRNRPYRKKQRQEDRGVRDKRVVKKEQIGKIDLSRLPKTERGETELIVLRFCLNYSKLLPPGLREGSRPQRRRGAITGTEILGPTPRTSACAMLDSLDADGYRLVDAYTRHEREKDFAFFVFGKKTSDGAHLGTDHPEILNSLNRLLSESLWGVVVHENPYYREGRIQHGKRALSISFAHRVPLIHPDGTFIRVWKKDANGKRIGSTPEPIEADHVLSVLGGEAIIT